MPSPYLQLPLSPALLQLSPSHRIWHLHLIIDRTRGCPALAVCFALFDFPSAAPEAIMYTPISLSASQLSVPLPYLRLLSPAPTFASREFLPPAKSLSWQLPRRTSTLTAWWLCRCLTQRRKHTTKTSSALQDVTGPDCEVPSAYRQALEAGRDGDTLVPTTEIVIALRCGWYRPSSSSTCASWGSSVTRPRSVPGRAAVNQHEWADPQKDYVFTGEVCLWDWTWTNGLTWSENTKSSAYAPHPYVCTSPEQRSAPCKQIP